MGLEEVSQRFTGSKREYGSLFYFFPVVSTTVILLSVRSRDFKNLQRFSNSELNFLIDERNSLDSDSIDFPQKEVVLVQ